MHHHKLVEKGKGLMKVNNVDTSTLPRTQWSLLGSVAGAGPYAYRYVFAAISFLVRASSSLVLDGVADLEIDNRGTDEVPDRVPLRERPDEFWEGAGRLDRHVFRISILPVHVGKYRPGTPGH